MVIWKEYGHKENDISFPNDAPKKKGGEIKV
jgi:hypothetical protein